MTRASAQVAPHFEPPTPRSPNAPKKPPCMTTACAIRHRAGKACLLACCSRAHNRVKAVHDRQSGPLTFGCNSISSASMNACTVTTVHTLIFTLQTRTTHMTLRSPLTCSMSLSGDVAHFLSTIGKKFCCSHSATAAPPAGGIMCAHEASVNQYAWVSVTQRFQYKHKHRHRQPQGTENAGAHRDRRTQRLLL